MNKIRLSAGLPFPPATAQNAAELDTLVNRPRARARLNDTPVRTEVVRPP